ncbi:uncharacterized protein N7498_000025 [Penicillium cinerascens]|uniref:Uncharacterized protein n=1 Tax=Penicillium cinerascens TaxID=70096 RepID=A0A9W9TCX2_9EURO|nr:uncharacterized protein N7498_000025 [Penicillium cinerascens]KAJ5217926.1 hypothetical protein N7498_000025 [Penicillium cinerascens]
MAIHAARRIQGLAPPAGAVGLLYAAAAQAEGCKNEVIADIDHAIYQVPKRKPMSLDASKDIAREI